MREVITGSTRKLCYAVPDNTGGATTGLWSTFSAPTWGPGLLCPPCLPPRCPSLTHVLENSSSCSPLEPQGGRSHPALPGAPSLAPCPSPAICGSCSASSLLRWLDFGPLRPQEKAIPARVGVSPAGTELYSRCGCPPPPSQRPVPNAQKPRVGALAQTPGTRSWGLNTQHLGVPLE